LDLTVQENAKLLALKLTIMILLITVAEVALLDAIIVTEIIVVVV
jgi:hypothetical protein